MEAMSFAVHVFGLEGCERVATSRRCFGTTFKVSTSLKQARPFTVRELIYFHHCLQFDPEIWNKMLAGAKMVGLPALSGVRIGHRQER